MRLFFSILFVFIFQSVVAQQFMYNTVYNSDKEILNGVSVAINYLKDSSEAIKKIEFIKLHAQDSTKPDTLIAEVVSLETIPSKEGEMKIYALFEPTSKKYSYLVVEGSLCVLRKLPSGKLSYNDSVIQYILLGKD